MGGNVLTIRSDTDMNLRLRTPINPGMQFDGWYYEDIHVETFGDVKTLWELNGKPSFLSIRASWKVPFNTQYIRLFGRPFDYNEYPIIISSRNELTQYYEYYKDIDLSLNTPPDLVTISHNFADLIERYPDDFFLNRYLVIFYRAENSGSIRHSVERVENNGDIIINRRSPIGQTMDMASWMIIIELEKGFKPEHFNAIFINAAWD
jgi:hypothetical protein